MLSLCVRFSYGVNNVLYTRENKRQTFRSCWDWAEMSAFLLFLHGGNILAFVIFWFSSLFFTGTHFTYFVHFSFLGFTSPFELLIG